MRRLLFIPVCFWLVGTAFAAPSGISVTGTLNKGETITISGSGFTTHTDNNEGSYTYLGESPIAAKFNDFESGAVESNGFSIENDFTAEWSIQTVNNRTGSTYYADRDYVSTRLATLEFNQSILSTGQIYASFYLRTWGSYSGGGKFFRWYFGPDSANDDLYVAFNDASDGMNSYCEARNDSVDYFSGFGPGAWHRVEIFADESANVFYVWIDGTLVQTETDYFSETYTFSPSGRSVNFGFISLPYDSDRHWGFDDIYFDYTRARVEICTGSEWASKGSCEIQIPTAWSTTSITAVVNTGEFPTSASRYLYVVDSAGDANSSGYPVTIGSSSSNITCYPDVDGDLYPGSGYEVVTTCSTNYYESSHFTAMTADCDDTNAAANPGETEICGNAVDEDCDGTAQSCGLDCSDGAEYCTNETDCGTYWPAYYWCTDTCQEAACDSDPVGGYTRIRSGSTRLYSGSTRIY